MGVGHRGRQQGESLGALADAFFQRCVGALKRFGGLETRRDIGERDDERAAGHAVGANFHNHVAVGEPFQIRLSLGRVGR